MNRALFLGAAALLAAACNSTQTVVAGGQLVSPTGLAVTTAGDRDLVFIANQGQDNLRALQICNHPLLADAGVDPADTCPTKEDFQFVPGPIRVFPANIETGNRPLHLSGARLLQADGGATGALLAVGADTNVSVIDARNLVDAAHRTAVATTLLPVDAGAPVADVVAVNAVDADGFEIGSPAVTAVAATVGPPAELVKLTLSVDADGGVAQPAIAGRCNLDKVLPRRLAVAPGGDTVYVADGFGDGVVRVAIAGITAAGGVCTVEHIGTGTGAHPDRPTRSVALSPIWYDAAGTHSAGELLMMILEPGTSVDAGTELDTGGILFARTADKLIVPVPPFAIGDKTAGLQPMEPITTPGMAREAAFLPALPPDAANCTKADGGPPAPPCTPLYTGSPSTAPVETFNLLVAVSSSDGDTYFIDVPQRRFVTSSYFDGTVQAPTAVQPTAISASVGTVSTPQLTLLPADATHPNLGWVTAGVTHSSRWEAIWHAPMPGLQTRGGTMTPSGGNILFKATGLTFATWVSDPVLALAPGDVVSFSGYTAPSGAPQTCIDLASTESASPQRFELSIVSISSDTLQLTPFAATATQRAFNLDPCPTGLGAAATIRTARDAPWLVYDGSTPRGRIKTGDTFLGNETRFDYPLDYSAAAPPLLTDNTAVAFTLSGDEPGLPGAYWTVPVNNGLSPVYYGDATQISQLGVASDVIAYRSRRRATQLFTAVTGQNSVVQADPTLPLTNSSTVSGGVITYK